MQKSTSRKIGRYFRTVLSSVTILASLGLHGQSEEYVVTLSGDTISGMINEGIRRTNQRICPFVAADGTETEFLPTELYGYGLKDGRFFKAINISERGAPDSIAFAQLLMRGRVSLLRHEDVLFMEKDEVAYLLEFDVKEVPAGSFSRMKTSHKYRRVINYLMSDCRGLTDRIQEVMYTPKSMEKIIELHCLCFNEDPVDYPNL